MTINDCLALLEKSCTKKVFSIFSSLLAGNRINNEDALIIYEQAELSALGLVADFIKKTKYKDFVFFNRNYHIEPTNICIYRCSFCSFSRNINDKDKWDLSIDEIITNLSEALKKGITEVHIVGGVHPNKDVYWYAELLSKIRQIDSEIHIKAFTAIELHYMIQKANLSLEEGLKILKKAGLNSIPGGGAELFNTNIRSQICPEKGCSSLWLEVHEAAHNQQISSNATMLYGLGEKPEYLFEHMLKLRNLQDKTGGFNAFIPLKYRNTNNMLSHLPELPYTNDLRVFAISRLFMDNISHLKAYWPMTGKDLARLLLSFGVDDIDGTIHESTKIYSMAGAEEQKPVMLVNEICDLIKNEGFMPVERNSDYKIIKNY